jgi:hypothetical protein
VGNVFFRILVSVSKVQTLHFTMDIYGQKLSFRNEIRLAALSLKLSDKRA